MAEDVRSAMNKFSRSLRLAKDRAQTQFGKVKERAKRFSLSGSPGSTGEASFRSFPGPGTQTQVEQLVDLGFSEAAARHALRACGSLEAAGVWLLDERNADEVMAAEVAAQEAQARPALVAGERARVSGLQNAPSLNGSEVVLRKWDEPSQRWIVSMLDGSIKSIRPQNLDPLQPSTRSTNQTEPVPAASGTAPSEPRAPHASAANFAEASAGSAAADTEMNERQAHREELEALARAMLASCGQPPAEEVLEALSEADLLELVEALSGRDLARSDRQEATSSSVRQSSAEPDLQDDHEAGDDDDSSRPFSAGYRPTDIANKQFELALEEARLRSLSEAQSKRAQELEAREAALLEAEAALKRRRDQEQDGREAPQSSEPAVVRIPFAPPEDVREQSAPSPTSLEVERAELQRLREEVETAARELDRRQDAAKRAAEERELQFLEEESAQMKLASSLREEEARLHMQRRSLGMLQQAMLKGGASEAVGEGGYVEHTMNDCADEMQGEEAGCSRSGADPCADKTDVEDDEVWDLDWSALSPGGLPSGPSESLNAHAS